MQWKSLKIFDLNGFSSLCPGLPATMTLEKELDTITQYDLFWVFVIISFFFFSLVSMPNIHWESVWIWLRRISHKLSIFIEATFIAYAFVWAFISIRWFGVCMINDFGMTLNAREPFTLTWTQFGDARWMKTGERKKKT